MECMSHFGSSLRQEKSYSDRVLYLYSSADKHLANIKSICVALKNA